MRHWKRVEVFIFIKLYEDLYQNATSPFLFIDRMELGAKFLLISLSKQQAGTETLYTWYGQGAKKWSLQQFQDKSLISSTEVDDNLATWTFSSFYASGNKKIEIHCEIALPTYYFYNTKGKRIKAYQTWEFNMFGESILPKSHYKLLDIFPRYTGSLLVKQEKGDASDFEGDEWVEAEIVPEEKTEKNSEEVGRSISRLKALFGEKFFT